jgi:hypothetical protein
VLDPNLVNGILPRRSKAQEGVEVPWPIPHSSHHQFPLEGYRRLTFMMLDRNVVAVSPSSAYRVDHIMERVRDAGAGFRSITEAVDTTTAAGRMVMQELGSFAELNGRWSANERGPA